MNLAYNQNYQYRGEHFSEIIPHMMQLNTREILVHKGGVVSVVNHDQKVMVYTGFCLKSQIFYLLSFLSQYSHKSEQKKAFNLVVTRKTDGSYRIEEEIKKKLEVEHILEISRVNETHGKIAVKYLRGNYMHYSSWEYSLDVMH